MEKKSVPRKQTQQADSLTGAERRSKEQLMSRTSPIPVDEILDEYAVGHTCYLEIHSPDGNTRRIPLKSSFVIIGRGAECDITLPMAGVSRKHARVRFNGEEYVIEDLDSLNGTVVNGVRVSRCVLRDLDTINIGKVRLTFSKERVREKR